MHNINANENTRLLETANAIVTPILETGKSVESGSILSGLSDANVGLAFAPVAPALVLAH
jgi:hypothetical protein